VNLNTASSSSARRASTPASLRGFTAHALEEWENASARARGAANARLQQWVNEMRQIMQPDSVHWCNGSDEESQTLYDQMVQVCVEMLPPLSLAIYHDSFNRLITNE